MADKFTPGPWFATTRQGSWDWLVASVADPNIEICQMFHDDTEENETGEANAMLVAQAPDMAAEIARLRAENERLTAALKAAEPHVRATNESEHMMDGFGGVRERPSDLDLDLVQRALTNG